MTITVHKEAVVEINETAIAQQSKRLKIGHSQGIATRLENGNIAEEEGDEDDDMFGGDIALDELEEITALNIKQPADITVEPSDIFGDDIALDGLEEVLDIPIVKEDRKKFTRYLVSSVTIERYTIEDVPFEEKVVLLIQEDKPRLMKARLRDDWKQSNILTGNVVHIPYKKETDEIIINNSQNFIIVQPDRLISCTAVADSFVCLRKSVLQAKVRSVSEYTEALVHGNIIHRVLQNALQMYDFRVENIRREMEHVVMNSLSDLYAIDQDERTALAILSEYAGSISQFGNKYVGKSPKPTAAPNTDIGLDPTREMGFDTLAISKVLDIEEHLWSATYGIKGMVDASIQMKMSRNNKVIAVPFELKTGKSSRFLTNRAQTLLYTLLMSDRYDIEVGAGVLYYSKTNTLYVVPSSHNELRSLIMARNALATAFDKRERIPEMIKNSHICQYCYLKDACTVYHKAVEKGDGTTSGLFNLFDENTGHMTAKTSEFFQHWWKLLDQEEVDIDYIRKDIWSQPADVRELLGRCLANMKLNLSTSEIDPLTSQWQYSFVRHESKAPSKLSCSIVVGDPIVVSSMEGHINLAMGFVSRISLQEITVSLTEPLRNPPKAESDFHSLTNQSFKPFIRFKADVGSFYSDKDMQYRIDKDDMTVGMGMLRNNLVMLAAKGEDSDRSRRLRELIIEKAKPYYKAETPSIPSSSKLNSDQKKALRKVLQAEDYTLILGMPGTGKTTTTAEIIKHLVSLGKSVLVAAYTHTALDNVLSKLRENGVDVLRLGNVEKVMPSMRDCVPSSNSKVNSVAAMKELYDSKKVVGVTCLGIGDVLLQKRKFDYCIIDEASQITLPTCIGPLRYAKTFVLVGDLYQLPPIVRNRDASEGGLDKSLFSILAEARPESICYLEYQYRMCREIMDVSNKLVYAGKLKCGNYQTSTRQLDIPNMASGLDALHQGENLLCKGLDDCWLKSILDPGRKVIFVNIDKLNAKESRPFGSFLQNDIEAKLIGQTAESLLKCGVTEEQLAIISVYRSQLRIILSNIKNRPGIEIATIDKYQGRDKGCVIISLVRNNDAGNSGDLLRDWRRLNVAMTRARSKLVLFGSANTLKSSALYSSMLDMFESNGWILDLQEGTEKAHDILPFVNENQPPQDPKQSSSKTKAFLPTAAILKKNDILRDIYNSSG